MEFFDLSKGYVYLGSYVDIVPVYSEYDVLQSHSDPVASMAAISPGTNSARPPFLWRQENGISGAGTSLILRLLLSRGSTTDNIRRPLITILL